MDPVRTQGLDHVAIAVSDLRRSHDFYASVLGLERRREEWSEPIFLVAEGTGVALFSAESHPGDETEGSTPRVRLMQRRRPQPPGPRSM